MSLVEQTFLVLPQIREVGNYVRKAQQVAITSIDPVFSSNALDGKDLSALRINVEGPKKYLKYFERLLAGANLNVMDEKA